jgi:hypothetical protein
MIAAAVAAERSFERIGLPPTSGGPEVFVGVEVESCCLASCDREDQRLLTFP